MKLLIEAKYVPNGTVVTKKTGEKKYRLESSFNVIERASTKNSEAENPLIVDAKEGTKLLVPLEMGGNTCYISSICDECLLCISPENIEESSGIENKAEILCNFLEVNFLQGD